MPSRVAIRWYPSKLPLPAVQYVRPPALVPVPVAEIQSSNPPGFAPVQMLLRYPTAAASLVYIAARAITRLDVLLQLAVTSVACG